MIAANDGRLVPRGMRFQEAEFFFRIVGENIDRDHDREPECAEVFDVFFEIPHSPCQRRAIRRVPLRPVEAAVIFQRPDGCDNHGEIGS